MAASFRLPDVQDWIPATVRQLLEDENDTLVKANALYINDEHWQNAEGWIGPRIAGDNRADELLEKGFIFRNVMQEIARRHAEGVTGNEPDWGLQPLRPLKEGTKPNDQEQRLIDEAELALTDWWDDKGVLDQLSDAVMQSTWARRGTLRLYIPAGLLGTPENGVVTLPRVTTLAEALRYIYIEHVPYDTGLVYTDPRTKAQAGAVTFDEDGRAAMEWTWLRNLQDPQSPAWLNTFVEGQERRTPFELRLGGRLTMHEIRPNKLLLGAAMQRMQRALNLSLSVVPRNIVTAGFLERVFLNAQMPGHWEKDPTTQQPTKFVPEPYTTGAGTTNFVQGEEGVQNPLTGQAQRSQASVAWREPVPPTGTVEAKRAQYEDMLEEGEQVHILIEGAASPSGVSRQEARAGYGRSLRRTQRPTQRGGRWILETAMALGEELMNQPGKYTGTLRATFDNRLDLGPISADDQRVAGEHVKSGMLSEPTGMVRIGVQDPDAEIARRNASPRAQLALKTDQLTALEVGTKIPGTTLEGVAEFIDVPPTDVTTLTKGAADAPKDSEGNPMASAEERARAKQDLQTQADVAGVPTGPVAP